MRDLAGLQVRFNNEWQRRKKLGFLLNSMEQTVEEDVIAMCPDEASVHFSRIKMIDGASPENLKSSANNIRSAAEVLLTGAPLDVLSYTCSSGVAINGEQRINAVLRDAKPDSTPNNALSSVVRAIRHLGGKTSTVVTPYTDSINVAVVEFLQQRGVAVNHLYGMGLGSNAEIDTVAPDFIEEAAVAAAREVPADVVFICCGSLRALQVINRVEQATGIPVVTSNQAMMWACLIDAGASPRPQEYGALWQNP